MADNFTIEIHCKKYVKAYLEMNCGIPADLRHMPDLLQELRSGLMNKPRHRERAEVMKWTDTVKVIIPPDYFYRHGWEMNKENELDFNKVVEQKIKFNMRQYVALNHALGFPVAVCIREFQEQFGFYEHIWSYESIKKDFYRNGKTVHLKTLRSLKEEIHKILLANLSEMGTYSKKLLKENCNG
jgi:hypothetical protein